MTFRLAWRELRNNARFALFFATNLAAGLVGLTAVEGLRYSLSDSIAQRSRAMLAADLSVSARREITPAEEKIVLTESGKGSELVRTLDLFSMVQSPKSKASRLGQLRAVEGRYPWYGELKLEKGGVHGTGSAGALKAGHAWLDSTLAHDLDLHVGDSFTAGGIPLVLDDIVTQDSTQAFTSFALGARVYVPRVTLNGSTLLGKGATATRTLLLKVPSGQASDRDLDRLETRLNEVLPDPAIKIRTHRRASEESSRLFSYLGDYLGLVSLSALLLAALGAVFQFRRFFLSRASSVAVLMALGGSRALAFRVFAVQLLGIGLLAALIAGSVGSLLLPLMSSWFQGIVPEGSVSWHLNPVAAASGLGMGILTSLLLCLPQLSALRGFSASALFREDFRAETGFRQARWFWYLPAVLMFFGLSVFVSKSWKLGVTFLGGLAFAVALLASLGALSLWALNRLSERYGSTELRLSLRHLLRARSTTWLRCLTVGLSAMLMSLIPQIRSNLEAELHGADVALRPSLFLFDLQEEQLPSLKKMLTEQKVALQNLSPFIRARLLSVNGKAFEKEVKAGDKFQTRETEQENSLRNRGFNLTYREKLTPSEELVKGREFSGKWDASSGKLPELSAEKNFAEKMGWKIGDHLSFEILGVPVEGEIVNTRTVRWTTFQPNFFVQFQAGVLEETPKTYLASIPPISEEAKTRLQDQVVTQFGNVSIIDIGRVIVIFEKLADQTSAALLLMALWTLIAGLLTLSAIARFEAYNRRWDMNLMKVLGASSGRVARVFLWDAAWVAAVSGTIGAAASVGVSYALARFVFDSEWKPELTSVFVTAGLSVVLSVVLTAFSAWRVWRERPLVLLSANRG